MLRPRGGDDTTLDCFGKNGDTTWLWPMEAGSLDGGENERGECGGESWMLSRVFECGRVNGL